MYHSTEHTCPRVRRSGEAGKIFKGGGSWFPAPGGDPKPQLGGGWGDQGKKIFPAKNSHFCIKIRKFHGIFKKIASFYLRRSRQVLERWELFFLWGGGLVCSRQSYWFPFVSPTHNFLRGGIHRSLTRFLVGVGSIKILIGISCSMTRFLLGVGSLHFQSSELLLATVLFNGFSWFYFINLVNAAGHWTKSVLVIFKKWFFD